jgi:hypothetical protein
MLREMVRRTITEHQCPPGAREGCCFFVKVSICSSKHMFDEPVPHFDDKSLLALWNLVHVSDFGRRDCSSLQFARDARRGFSSSCIPLSSDTCPFTHIWNTLGRNWFHPLWAKVSCAAVELWFFVKASYFSTEHVFRCSQEPFRRSTNLSDDVATAGASC